MLLYCCTVFQLMSLFVTGLYKLRVYNEDEWYGFWHFLLFFSLWLFSSFRGNRRDRQQQQNSTLSLFCQRAYELAPFWMWVWCIWMWRLLRICDIFFSPITRESSNAFCERASYLFLCECIRISSFVFFSKVFIYFNCCVRTTLHTMGVHVEWIDSINFERVCQWMPQYLIKK